MIAFYKSPTGKKAIQVLPQVLRESLSRASDVLGPRIEQVIKEVFEEEKKSEKQPPAGPRARTQD
jgi:hypothetical protein